MITTVTTSTVTTVTTIAAMGLTVGMGIAAIVSLIIFLTSKELVSAAGSGSIVGIGKFHSIARFLNVGILPLLMAFAVIAAVRIVETI